MEVDLSYLYEKATFMNNNLLTNALLKFQYHLPEFEFWKCLVFGSPLSMLEPSVSNAVTSNISLILLNLRKYYLWALRRKAKIESNCKLHFISGCKNVVSALIS